MPLGAAAQDYPNKPVTMLVPFAAGGPTDTIARLTAAGMSKSLGQQVIVEPPPGRRRHDCLDPSLAIGT